MSSENGRRYGGSGATGEDAIDVARYMGALRRSAPIIVAVVAIVTGAVIAFSLTLHKTYTATASVVVNNTSGVTGGEPEAVQRSLATTATLATTAAVLGEAAQSVPGETRASLSKLVSSSVDESANIIDIKVNYGSARGAAALAYAVAQAFLNQHAALQRTNTASTLSVLNSQIATLRARKSTEPGVAAQLTSLQAHAAELEAASAGTNSQLELVERPATPTAPSSPRPFRNGAIALFASLFLAVLVVIGREQLTPRVASQRELGHLLSLPVLSAVPLVRGRVDAVHARAEYEAYQTLSAALRLALPPGSEPHVTLVTSATHGEGKTTVTSRLGRMLAQAGHRTLIVSGDLRWPRLDDAFDVNGTPGIRQLLAFDSDDPSALPRELDKLIIPALGDASSRRGQLDILPAGRHEGDASELLHTSALPSLMDALRQTPYAYILVDSTPILGVADAQRFAQFCDELVVVARLDHLKVSDVIDVRETLERLDCKAVGLVVIGTRLTGSPYYLGEGLVSERTPVRIVG